MMPQRHAFWELYPDAFGWSRIFVYFMALVAMACFGYGLYQRIRLWKRGKPLAGRFDNLAERVIGLFRYGFLQVKILRKAYQGIFHSVIFWGFVMLFIGTSLTVLDEDFYRLITGQKFIQGTFYIGFSWLLDIAGVLAIAGIAMAAWRRYIKKPDLLDNRKEDRTLLWLILAILATGFLTEAVRISHEMNGFEKYASPFGYMLAIPLAGLGHGGKMAIHALFWFTHLFLALGFIAFLPWTKGFHILAGWFNVFTRDLGPRGGLPAIPKMMERMEVGEDVEMGYKSIDDFTWKERLMLDACTRCGRCQDVCPAFNTGKELNPKMLIQDSRPLMLAQLLKDSPSEDRGCLLEAECKETGAIKNNVLWSCTTCMACMEACPVLIEHVPLIVQMRRELAMEFDALTKEGRTLFKNMDVNANPWGMAPADRVAWTEGLEIPTVLDNPEFEYLFFVGCLGSYDPRSQSIARAVVKILKAAKINFAILGEMELCCGDPIRRLGNEASFQALVGMTRDMLAEAEVKVRKVITLCPHCFNTLKHEYKDFGLNWDVVHHSELIARLVANGELALKPGEPVSGVVHDSCYLGRYNGIYDEPREIASAAGVKLLSLDKSREDGFCCGGGGGRTWLEEEVESVEDKINVTRITQLAGTGAKLFLSACPYCMMMFDEGAKLKKVRKGDAIWRAYQVQGAEAEVDLIDLIELKDLAELVAERLEGAGTPEASKPES